MRLAPGPGGSGRQTLGRVGGGAGAPRWVSAPRGLRARPLVLQGVSSCSLPAGTCCSITSSSWSTSSRQLEAPQSDPDPPPPLPAARQTPPAPGSPAAWAPRRRPQECPGRGVRTVGWRWAGCGGAWAVAPASRGAGVEVPAFLVGPESRQVEGAALAGSVSLSVCRAWRGLRHGSPGACGAGGAGGSVPQIT